MSKLTGVYHVVRMLYVPLVCCCVLGVPWGAAAWDARGTSGGERLLAAAQRGDAAAVEKLVRGGGVNVDEVESGSLMTPLMYAARNGHAGVARVLLAHGANLRAVAGGHGTALSNAAAWGRSGMVSLLLAAGAAPDGGAPQGYTPLMAARLMGHRECVELLLAAGAADTDAPVAEKGAALAAAAAADRRCGRKACESRAYSPDDRED